jgi:hypothetical protein
LLRIIKANALREQSYFRAWLTVPRRSSRVFLDSVEAPVTTPCLAPHVADGLASFGLTKVRPTLRQQARNLLDRNDERATGFAAHKKAL